jgi:hypothetical protein
VTFECGTGKLPSKSEVITKEKYIVPVGGGKDSVVSLELLNSEQLIPMIINPLTASLDTARTAGYPIERVMEVQRMLDPLLLEMNTAGFLNGHTPFSALVSFISMMGAVLTGSNKIALSNESSANEATIPGTHINHQYSKSFAYEQQFREYTGKHISGSIKYFSFLRPLNEFQIAGIFSGYPAYAYLFRSCNAGSKKNIWCGKCPKCLFTYIILSPFVEANKLKTIFGKDLLNDKGLYHHFLELTGYSKHKPFECVGTIDEIRGSLDIFINNSGDSSLPYLLEVYKDKRQKGGIAHPRQVDLGSFLNPEHNLDNKDLNKIREVIHA